MAILNNFCPACTEDFCVDSILPALPANHCESVSDAKITEIFYTDRAHPLTADPALVASWSRVSNVIATGFPIRSLAVDNFEKPVPTLNYKLTRSGNSASLDISPRQISGVIEDSSTPMYELMRKLQCNGNVLFWYRAGGYIYGGQSGIKGVIKPTHGIVNGSEIAFRWNIAIDYASRCEEERVVAAI